MPDLVVRRPLRLFAPAKINLGLEVLQRRGDGYHEILSIMQSVSLFDEILLTPSDRVDFRSDPRVEPDSDLAYRAVQRFQVETGIVVRARIRVVKHIPLAGGLGGGSSDAGTLLRALCDLTSVPAEAAHGIAAALGSDVPFFLSGGTALASGTGTTIDQLPDLARTWIVLVTPAGRTANKTQSAYAALTEDDFSDGITVENAASALRQGTPVLWATLPSAFARTALTDSAVASAREVLLAAGAEFVLLSGAGPSLYTIVDTWQSARDLAARLSTRGLTPVVCTTIGRHLNAERIANSYG